METRSRRRFPPGTSLEGASTKDLFAGLYDTLRALARRRLQRPTDRTVLQPTALVHEAYLKLAGPGEWSDPGRFFAAASRAMYEVLVEHARRRRSGKRGGGALRVQLEDLTPAVTADGIDLLALQECLERFARIDRRAHQVVGLRCFGGLELDQIARLLGVSTRTVKRDWATARLWLLEQLDERDRSAPS